MDIPASEIKPFYSSASAGTTEPHTIQETIDILSLNPHTEGGYFIRTDRNPLRVPNPFPDSSAPPDDPTNTTRAASSAIFYFLTPGSPLGAWHQNRARTVHTLHRGRGRYVIIHADEVENGRKARVESFVVGDNLAAGERLQWIVDGGKYKSSYLLPDNENSEDGSTRGMLISEVCTKKLRCHVSPSIADPYTGTALKNIYHILRRARGIHPPEF